MGLDIYLYRYENYGDTIKREEQYDKYSNSLWGDRKYESFTEVEKNEIRAKEKTYADSLGLDEFGNDKFTKESIEIASKNYPDHYFKIGYFRSSYNEGGINRILSDAGLWDLYQIFDRDKDDEYSFQPNWILSLKNVKKVIMEFKEKPNFRCEKFSWNQFRNPSEYNVIDTKSAMSAFMREYCKTHDGGYSNLNGLFTIKDPMKVFGIIHGIDKAFFSDQIYPCSYFVYEGNNEWYIQALEIVQETIEYVLIQPDIEKYYLHWSS